MSLYLFYLNYAIFSTIRAKILTLRRLDSNLHQKETLYTDNLRRRVYIFNAKQNPKKIYFNK